MKDYLCSGHLFLFEKHDFISCEVASWKKYLVSLPVHTRKSRHSIATSRSRSRSIRHVCVLVSDSRGRFVFAASLSSGCSCSVQDDTGTGQRESRRASKDRPAARSLFARRRLHNGPRSIQYAASDAGRKRDAPNRHALYRVSRFLPDH